MSIVRRQIDFPATHQLVGTHMPRSRTNSWMASRLLRKLNFRKKLGNVAPELRLSFAVKPQSPELANSSLNTRKKSSRKRTIGGSSFRTEAISVGGENIQEYSGTTSVEVLSLTIFLRENHGRLLLFDSRFFPIASISPLVLDRPLMWEVSSN